MKIWSYDCRWYYRKRMNVKLLFVSYLFLDGLANFDSACLMRSSNSKERRNVIVYICKCHKTLTD